MPEDGLPPFGEEVHLGDGLYASFDGWYLRLRAPRENGDHWVGIEPGVWNALRKWIDRYPRLKEHLE